MLSTRSASLLNFAEISRSSGLPQTTLVIFQPAGNPVPGVPFTGLGVTRQALGQAPKVFLPDSGLLAHLGDLSPERLTISGTPGSLVETFVLSELLKHLAFSERCDPVALPYTINIEVDLSETGGKLTGVKASHSIGSKDFNGLRHLKETEPQFEAWNRTI